MKSLIEGGFIRVRVNAVPTAKVFDGWLSVVKPREWNKDGQSQASVDTTDVVDVEEPINLDEIPF